MKEKHSWLLNSLSLFKPPNQKSREALDSQQLQIGSHQLTIHSNLKELAIKISSSLVCFIILFLILPLLLTYILTNNYLIHRITYNKIKGYATVLCLHSICKLSFNLFFFFCSAWMKCNLIYS